MCGGRSRRGFAFYGSTDGDARTTFTGAISVNTGSPQSAEVTGIALDYGSGTIFLIENMPGMEVLSFFCTRFIGNETYISNPSGHPIDTSRAVFD